MKGECHKLDRGECSESGVLSEKWFIIDSLKFTMSVLHSSKSIFSFKTHFSCNVPGEILFSIFIFLPLRVIESKFVYVAKSLTAALVEEMMNGSFFLEREKRDIIDNILRAKTPKSLEAVGVGFPQYFHDIAYFQQYQFFSSTFTNRYGVPFDAFWKCLLDSFQSRQELFQYNIYVFLEKMSSGASNSTFLLENPMFAMDKGCMMKLVARNWTLLEYASERLRSDKDLVSEAVSKCSSAFRHASDTLKGDQAFILKMLEKDVDVLQHALQSLKSEPNFIRQAIQIDPRVVQYASHALTQDRNFLLSCSSSEGTSYVAP
mmetsp:Transcript_7422/g.27741  ORF Transcript_7422/g.27741 Transcript_7422/m.27741 type:complete len:318 (-) Transcript_7422:1557-2510(-)